MAAVKLDVATLEHVLELVSTAVHMDKPLYQVKGDIAKLVNEAKADGKKLKADVEHVVHEIETDAADAYDALKAKIAGIKSHADAHQVATDLGLDVPADVKAPWGDVKTVAQKADHLATAAEQAKPSA